MAYNPRSGAGAGSGAATRALDTRTVANSGTTLEFSGDTSQINAQLARDKGRFTNLQRQAIAAHREMAEKAAETISAYLAAKVRANARTQRKFTDSDSLVMLIKSPGNLDYNVDGFVVGKRGFLESSSARAYWRNLEEGTRIFVGRELRGFFISASGHASPPSGDRFKRDPRLIQTNKFFAGTRESQQELAKQKKRNSLDENGRLRSDFRPDQQTYGRAKRRLKESTVDRHGRVKGFKIIIHNPIPAYEYFFFGGQQYNVSGHIQATYRKHGVI